MGNKPNSFLIMDMGIGNEIVDDQDIDFYYYEKPIDPGIELDWAEIAVAQDDGTDNPGTFTVVFIWGDENPDNNGAIPLNYNPEIPNEPIVAADLHNNTGIGIDIGNDDGTKYRFVRFQTHPIDAMPPANQLVEVDAIEGIHPTPTPTETPTSVEIPTDTPTPSPTDTPTLTELPTDTPTIEVPTETSTSTELATDTSTPEIPTEIPTRRPRPTKTPTNTHFPYTPPTAAPTSTATYTPTNTVTATYTPTSTFTATQILTSTQIPTSTVTLVSTPVAVKATITPDQEVPSIVPDKFEITGIVVAILSLAVGIVGLGVGILPEDEKRRLWKSLRNRTRTSNNTRKLWISEETNKDKKSKPSSTKRRRK